MSLEEKKEWSKNLIDFDFDAEKLLKLFVDKFNKEPKKTLEFIKS